MKIIILLIASLKFSFLFSQSVYNINGKILDSAQNPIGNATITLKYIFENEKIIISKSDSLGRINIKKVEQSKFTLKIECIGFQTFVSDYFFPSTHPIINVDPIQLITSRNLLEEVTVIAKVPAIIFKEDTIEYKADSFIVKKDAVVEDLLKKLPGIKVRRDGTIEAQGKIVTKIKVNGKDFFEGDPKTATKNLPANIVDKIQVIDDYGEASGFTGFKNSQAEKIINIQLKKEKKQGFFVNLENGYGTEKHYNFRNTINYFDNVSQFSAFTNNNNIGGNGVISNSNKPFIGNMSSLMQANNKIINNLGGTSGVTSLIANQDIGFIGAIQNFGNGVNKNSTYGIRYSNEGIKRLKLYISYLNSSVNNTLFYKTNGIQFLDKNKINEYQNLENNSSDFRQRIFSNIEYTIDSFFSIKIIPSITRNRNSGVENSFTSNKYNTTILNSNLINNIISLYNNEYSFDLLIKKKFKKNKHTLYFESIFSSNPLTNNLNGKYMLTTNSTDTTKQIINSKSNSTTISNNLFYVIPFNKNTNLRFSYSYNLSLGRSNKQTSFYNPINYDYEFSKTYSGMIESNTNSHLISADLKLKNKIIDYTFGLAIQSMSINRKDQINLNTNYNKINLLPLIQINCLFSKTKILNFKYSGSVVPPTPSQVLVVTDTSNPLISYKGNINLKSEFKNIASISYYNFNYVKGNLMLVGISFIKNVNAIIPSIVYDSAGKSSISLINTNQNNDLQIYYDFSKPYKNKLIEITIGGNLALSRYAFFNNNIKIVNTFKINQSLEITYNKSWGEFSIKAGLNTNQFSLKDSILTSIDYSYTQRSVLFIDNFKLGFDITLIKPEGYLIEANKKNLCLINCFVEKKIKNEWVLKIEGNDLLNQSLINFTRVMNINKVNDYRYNVVGRFFLISFIYKMNHFSLGKK